MNTILAIVLGDAFTKHDKAVLSAMAFAGMVAGQLCKYLERVSYRNITGWEPGVGSSRALYWTVT